MVTKKQASSQPQVVEVSEAQAKAAIPKFERFVTEVNAFEPASATGAGKNAATALRNRIDTALLELFGGTTRQYGNFYVQDFGSALWRQIRHGEPSSGEVLAAYTEGKEKALQQLHSLVAYLRDKVTVLEENPGLSASGSFSNLDLHADIVRASVKLFKDGHYAEAVEAACKMLEGRVRQLSGENRIGTDLMQAVFSEKNPSLRFNAMADDHDRNEQRGMMFLYAGTMSALRNPRAHGFVSDPPHSALKMIAFVDFLYRALDSTVAVD